MSNDKESFGDSILGAIMAVILASVLFGGDPDIATSVRIWAGKEAGTIPADYIYVPEEQTQE